MTVEISVINPDVNIQMESLQDCNDRISRAYLFYMTDRPEEWLALPTPNTNEIYALYLVDPVIGSADVRFAIRTTSATYQVEVLDYDLAPRVFDSVEVVYNASQMSTFSMPFDSTRPQTDEGFCQYVIKFSVPDGTFREINFDPLSSPWTPYEFYSLYDIKVNAPTLERLGFSHPIAGNRTQLRYAGFFTPMPYYLYGAENYALSSGTALPAFVGLSKLRAVYGYDTPEERAYRNGTAYGWCANGCNELHYFDGIHELAPNSFNGNSNLREVNLSGVQYVTDLTRVFKSCSLIQEISFPVSASWTNVSLFETFNLCVDLKSILGLKIGGVALAQFTFGSCHSLRDLTFLPETEVLTAPSFAINDSYAFTRESLIAMFRSLPQLSDGMARTITLGRNSFGARELTEDDLEIANNKGWSVAI